MILVDANILLYAEDKTSPIHKTARGWWDACLSGGERVCLCWEVINAFIRIGTSKRVFEKPLSLKEAIVRVQSWFDQPVTELVVPTDNHWSFFEEMMKKGQASANLVSDAHLAALAVEHGCTLYSSDADFSRFPRLKWKNPLEKSFE
ncbi:MAG: type II toxin-antitoxin system VapC family toxin [Deltaproteobacteria bacterium]|nr:type II toxin-antitoxin system VapC family toxin [Deltaproteobacteria bacterium]